MYTAVTSFVPYVWNWKRRVGKHIWQLAPEIDCCVLKWTFFNTLVEDHELNRFFQSILGFCSSTIVKEPRHIIHGLGESKLSLALIGFLGHTWFNFLSNSDKMWRLVLYVKVADVKVRQDLVLNVSKSGSGKTRLNKT
jgi:hypothetical protein